MNFFSPLQMVWELTRNKVLSDRRPIRRPLATGRYRRNPPSVVDFDRGRGRKKKREKKKMKKRERYLLFPGSPRNPSLAGDSSPAGFLLPA
ncbi:hypothetical protein BHE74_00004762 [Ensete ventricosum]|nr:hypothetical protein BHE74_00004762 [Ensete ventricosum]